MAMKRKPKPLRPDPLKATLVGERSTRTVRQIGITGPLKKETVRNPNAPTGGSGGSTGSVRVLTPTESALKKRKVEPGKKTTPSKTYGTYSARARESQKIAGTNYQSGMSLREYQNQKKLMKTANAKVEKPTKTTPKKKTEPKPKPKAKRKLFVGRGGGMRGGSGGGGALGAGAGMPDYNR